MVTFQLELLQVLSNHSVVTSPKAVSKPKTVKKFIFCKHPKKNWNSLHTSEEFGLFIISKKNS